MYNNKKIIERRTEMFKSQLNKARDDYENNLKSFMQSYLFKPLTKTVQEIIQREVDSFLERNELGINVYVEIVDGGIIIIGRTLIDEIVWEHIHKKF